MASIVIHTLCAAIGFGVGYLVLMVVVFVCRTRQFVRLIRDGDVDQLRLLIASLSVDQLDAVLHIEYPTDAGDRLTALTIAALYGHAETAALLLDEGADVHQTSTWRVNGHRMRCTPLWFAAAHGHFSVCRVMIENGAIVDMGTDSGHTPLMMASMKAQCVDIVRLLVENEATIDLQDGNGITALISASAEGHLENVALLVQHGANIDHTDIDGHTALMYASIDARTDVVQHLLTAGASSGQMNSNGRTAMDLAADRGHAEIVNILRVAAEQEAAVDGQIGPM